MVAIQPHVLVQPRDAGVAPAHRNDCRAQHALLPASIIASKDAKELAGMALVQQCSTCALVCSTQAQEPEVGSAETGRAKAWMT